MNLEWVSNSKVEEVLIQADKEGYYVNCPWLDGEKIEIQNACNFVDGGCCKNFIDKKSVGEVDYVRCKYKLTQIS